MHPIIFHTDDTDYLDKKQFEVKATEVFEYWYPNMFKWNSHQITAGVPSLGRNINREVSYTKQVSPQKIKWRPHIIYARN